MWMDNITNITKYHGKYHGILMIFVIFTMIFGDICVIYSCNYITQKLIFDDILWYLASNIKQWYSDIIEYHFDIYDIVWYSMIFIWYCAVKMALQKYQSVKIYWTNGNITVISRGQWWDITNITQYHVIVDKYQLIFAWYLAENVFDIQVIYRTLPSRFAEEKISCWKIVLAAARHFLRRHPCLLKKPIGVLSKGFCTTISPPSTMRNKQLLLSKRPVVRKS